MSYEKYEKFKGELSRADYRSYLSQVWWLVDYCFSEWWNAIQSPKPVLTTSKINLMYDNFTVASINLWILIKDYVKLDKKEDLVEFTERVLDLPTLSGDTNKAKEEALLIVLALATYVKRLVHLSESVSGVGLPD